MLNFMKLGKKSGDTGPSHSHDRDWKQVFLHITDHDWQASVVDPDKPEEPMLRGGDGSGLVEEIGDHPGTLLERMFRLSGDSFKGKDGLDIKEVHILIDDSRLIYNDMCQDVFASAGAAVLLDIGRQQLHCRAVTFGVAPFGRIGQSVRSNGVISFMDVARLSGFLTQLDKLATKIKSVTPIADVLVRRAAGGSEPYAGLSIGALYSHLVMANPIHGTVVYRCLPFGTSTIIRLLAEGNGISMAEATAVVAEQDMLSDLSLLPMSGDGDTMLTTSAERLLGEPVRKFMEEITLTFDFFENQRGAGRPASLEVFGDFATVLGLDAVLQRLGEPVRMAEVSLFEIFRSLPVDQRMNLLSEAGAELKIGSSFFSFHKEELRPTESVRKAIAHQEKSRQQDIDKRKEERRLEKQRKEERRKKSKGSGYRRIGSSKSISEQFSALISKIPFRKKPEAEEFYEEQNNDNADLIGFAAVAGFLLLIFYWAYDQYSEISMIKAGQIAGYSNSTLQVGTLRSETEKTLVRGAHAADADKVLWTEKILALAKSMTNEMWLTDLYLKNDTKGNDRNDRNVVATKRLVLEGAVLPSTEGHMLQIGEYIQRLEADTEHFMTDFREIVFQGMMLDSSESDQVVRFVIEAVYDEGKGREIRVNAPAAGGGDVKQIKQLMDNRNKSLDQSAQ
ncbi:MAG: hypothetical protein WCF85_05915 [Rhodospirillaceae bacterium]